ncbi:hypothetical protein, partial [Serratia marcescens]|uniref:hypothetical protein n=1 Tax=Serratia marcescens TaxID=615 RepID=UPI0013DC5C7F
ILLLIDRDPTPVSPYTLALAAALKAHVTAVCMVPERLAARLGGSEVPPIVLQQAYERVQQEADKALSDFAAAAQLAGVICETIAMATDPHDP